LKLQGYQVELRAIKEEDLERVRNWRNDPGISGFMLSQSIISPVQQQAWFERIRKAQDQCHWLIYYKNEPVGAANIKSAQAAVPLQQAESIEPGLYIADSRYKGNILAFAPSLLIADYCFERLGVNQLKARVKPENQAAIKYNQRLGYDIESTGELVTMVLTQQAYTQATQAVKALLSRPRQQSTKSR
jgi:RimJ/RimL family protein N-acetyltransferase